MSGAPVAHLWRVDPRALEDPDVLARCLDLLSAAERARHDRLAARERRLELAAAHALVRLALGAVTGTRAGAWRVRRDSVGRPLVEGPVEGVHVSVSHTPGLVACLVASGREVGVDAEQVSSRVPYMRVAEQVFAPAELAELRALDEPARIDRFFLLWSVKEALAKASGDRAGAAVLPVPTGGGGAMRVEAGRAARPWHLRWTRPGPEHVLATCVGCAGCDEVAIEEHEGLP